MVPLPRQRPIRSQRRSLAVLYLNSIILTWLSARALMKSLAKRNYSWSILMLLLVALSGCDADDKGAGSVGDASVSSGVSCPGFTDPGSCPAGCKRTNENVYGEIWCGQPCSAISDCDSGGFGCGVYGYCAPVCALNSDCDGFQGCGFDQVCSLCQEGGPC